MARRAKVLWLNYPNSPSGAVVDEAFYREALAFARPRGIIVASDEAYSEIYFGSPPLSCLNVAKEGVLVFQSLSKRSAMTGYRIGWVMGDPELVAIFRKTKTNIDSGTPTFLQDAAIAALGDEEHVEGIPPGVSRPSVTSSARPWSRRACRTAPRPPRCTSGSGCPKG